MLFEILTHILVQQIHHVFASVFIHEKDPKLAIEIAKDVAVSVIRKEIENDLIDILERFELSEEQLDVLVFNAKERLSHNEKRG